MLVLTRKQHEVILVGEAIRQPALFVEDAV